MSLPVLRILGRVRSGLGSLDEAPPQGEEGGSAAWLELDEALAPALTGIRLGQELVLLTWLHRARRDTLLCHPRSDPSRPLTGVFATRSPNRPNPIGLHRVQVRRIEGTRLLVFPLEAIDGTPILDLKAAWRVPAAPGLRGQLI